MVIKRAPEADTHEIAILALGRKNLPGCKGNAFFDGLAIQIKGVDALGQFNPQYKTAFGPGNADFAGEIFLDGLQIAQKLGVQGLAQTFQVQFIPTVFQEIRNGGLLQGRRGNRMNELVVRDLLRPLARERPADAVAWRQRLGERTALHHKPLGIKGFAGFGAVLAEVHFAVNIILDQGNIIFIKHFHQLTLAVIGHAATQGIVEIWHKHAGADVEFA